MFVRNSRECLFCQRELSNDKENWREMRNMQTRMRSGIVDGAECSISCWFFSFASLLIHISHFHIIFFSFWFVNNWLRKIFPDFLIRLLCSLRRLLVLIFGVLWNLFADMNRQMHRSQMKMEMMRNGSSPRRRSEAIVDPSWVFLLR